MTNVDKQISILGCGWLGLPLAKRILANHSTWNVKGSTTSDSKIEQFRSAGIDPFHFGLNPEFSANQAIIDDFFKADTLIISLPPRLSQTDAEHYPQQMEAVVREVRKSEIQNVIFISSTGVYPDLGREMAEDDVVLPEHSPSAHIVIAENLIATLRGPQNVLILRLGGLLGYNRNPGKYVKGQKDLKTGSIPVNYIHRDDAVEVILKVIEEGVPDETFNIVAPKHPIRREVYENTCAQFGWEAPTFIEPAETSPFKIISNAKWTNAYPDFEFNYPDPLVFLYTETDPEMA